MEALKKTEILFWLSLFLIALSLLARAILELMAPPAFIDVEPAPISTPPAHIVPPQSQQTANQ